VNALWPRTVIATSAVQNLLGGDATMQGARTPEIMADAAHAILTKPSRECTGNFFIDEDVLRARASPTCRSTASAARTCRGALSGHSMSGRIVT
jgi:hypothetical protein